MTRTGDASIDVGVDRVDRVDLRVAHRSGDGVAGAATVVPPASAVVCRGAQPTAVARLVCFPHSGGGPMSFPGWPARLGPDIEVWTVVLPGRSARSREPFARDWAPLVADLAAAVRHQIPAPYVLFGHSLGAAIAFEVARVLVRLDAAPTRLMVSARSAPDVRERLTVPTDDRELAEKVDRVYGGIPDAVRAAPDLMAYFLPVIRADLELAAAYTYEPEPPLPIPITAFAGDRDITVPSRALERWGAHTTAGFAAHVLPGGHFYLNEHEGPILDAVRQRIIGDLTKRQRAG